MLINGSLCRAGAAYFAFQLPHQRALVRPIYVHLSILPPLTTGVAAASELEGALKD